MSVTKRAIVALALYFIILSTISSCSLNNLFGPEDPPPVVKKEWDARLKNTRWVCKKETLLNYWVFTLDDYCYNTFYQNHLKDSLLDSPSSISMSWHSSNDSILHTSTECVFHKPASGSSGYTLYFKRDWNYYIRNDTILVVDSVEFVKIIKDTVQ